MYQPMLYLHWKQVRFGLIPFILAAYVLPLLSVQGMGVPAGVDAASLDAYRVVSEGQVWLPFYPLLAAAIGVTLALSAWNWDHQLKHVYSLSLPLTRLEYSMLKMGAGAALAVLPVVALWVGSHVATMSVSLPEGLHAYPNHLTMRFGLAVLLCYSLFFALASGTIKTTILLISSVVAFFIVGEPVSDFLATYFVALEERSLIQIVVEWTITAPGPFEVFTGNWTLIDV